MKLKKIIAAMMAATMVFSMAACGGSSTTATTAAADATTAAAGDTTAAAEGGAEVGSEPVTLRFSWWGGDSRHAATQEAVDAFMAKYPNITVETEFGAWDGWEEKAATQLMSNTAPDVMQINWNWITSYSSDGSAFTDLNTVSDILDLTQWDSAQLDQCKIGDSIQAVPIAMTGRIFYWNKTTFEKAGLTVPTSFEELMAAGPVFKEKLGDEYYPLTMAEYDRIFFVVHYLESKYGKAWVENGELQYSETEIQEALDLLASMEEAHVIPTIKKILGDGADSLDKNQNWIDGKYAGILEWDSSAKKFMDAAEGSEIVVGDPFKDWGEYQGGFTKVSMGFAIPASCEHPKEAALLMQFLLNEEDGVKLMASERGIPASKAALEICTANDLLNPATAEANGKVMAWNSFPLDPYFEDASLKSKPDGVYYKVFSKVSYGEEDSAAGAKELIAGITAAETAQ